MKVYTLAVPLRRIVCKCETTGLNWLMFLLVDHRQADWIEAPTQCLSAKVDCAKW